MWKENMFLWYFFGGGELFLVNLDVTGSLDHTCMQINKNNITNQKKINQAYSKVNLDLDDF